MTETERNAIRQIQSVTGLTGGAYAVIDGETLRTECFGYADPEAGRPITERSFFDIASNSKAFTAMLGAIASGEGRFDWDAPVREFYPDFGLLDEYAAAHMTGRDLACHRSGLARHEFMRARVYTSIADMAHRTRYMEFSRGFRESYEYNNHMFIVLGHVMECVYGQDWRSIVLERIAGPLGMEMRFRGRDCDFTGLDCALPHRPDGKGGTYRCAYADNEVAGPCGGIRTNLQGMIAWLRCLLDSGAPLCTKEAFEALLVPNVPTESENNYELFNSYALGWRTSAYRGKRLVYHGGAITGFQSHVAFFPEEHKGIVILMNTSSTTGATLLRDVLLDELCGCTPEPLTPRLNEWKASMAGRAARVDSAYSGRVPPDAMRAWLCGTFYHPAYDDFTISEWDGELWLDYGNFSAPVRVMEDGTIIACEQDPVPDYMKLRRMEGGLSVETSDLAMWLPFQRVTAEMTN